VTKTRGTGIELLNGAFKKMIANKISKVKLVFMIPKTVFTYEGNYGLGFK
jgi:hypothetical protein